jgi:uncharacterized protein
VADAETGHGPGAAGSRDEHGRASEPLPRPGSDGEHALQERLGSTARADRFYDQQVLDHLNARMREFTEEQEMFFLATADRHGECDNSFRAGPPGFLRVLDDRTLIYPEYRGNGVHASLGNLQENPHVGLLLMDFQRARIGLHVNGRAEVCEDGAVREEYPDLPVDPVPGRRAQLWVKVRVEEAYIHCAKHIPHLQKVPKGAGRDWGTDDHKRKGGDFFGAARDAKERGPVEWRPREHEVPPPEVPTPAPVLEPGQVPAPPSVPPSVAPGVRPQVSTAPGHVPAVAASESAAVQQGPRHARTPAAHQTPVAAWRAMPQDAGQEAFCDASPEGGVPPLPGVPPQLDGHPPGGTYAGGTYPGGTYPGGPYPEASYAEASYADEGSPTGASYQGVWGPDVSYPGDRYPDGSYAPGSGHDDSYAAGWHTVGAQVPGARRAAEVPPGAGAAFGASAVIAARDALPDEEDPDAWRQEAARALAEAQQRVAEEEASSFQGWFG